jgi:1-acyl-sn-glycerol-3-phosphate acyltransferase
MIPPGLQRFLLSLYFYPLFLLVSALGIPLLTLLVACCRPFLSHRRTMKRFRRAIAWYGRTVIALPFPFIRTRYEVLAGSTPGAPYIFVCNHRAASDPFLISLLAEEVVQIVNTWPFRLPVLGLYARFSGYLNIRMLPPEEFMARTSRLLAEGVSIVFFPEGTRSPSGPMGSFHGAAFRLALQTGVPIVPLCIAGNGDMPRKGSSLLAPGRVLVRRLPALAADEFRGLTAFALKNRVWQLMDRELAVMEGRG